MELTLLIQLLTYISLVTGRVEIVTFIFLTILIMLERVYLKSFITEVHIPFFYITIGAVQSKYDQGNKKYHYYKRELEI